MSQSEQDMAGLLLTEILKVDSDLMHPPSERSAEDHAGGPVEAHPLELRPALLAMAGDLAHSDLVADNLHWLRTLSEAPGQTTSVNICMLLSTEFLPLVQRSEK